MRWWYIVTWVLNIVVHGEMDIGALAGGGGGSRWRQLPTADNSRAALPAPAPPAPPPRLSPPSAPPAAAPPHGAAHPPPPPPRLASRLPRAALGRSGRACHTPLVASPPAAWAARPGALLRRAGACEGPADGTRAVQARANRAQQTPRGQPGRPLGHGPALSCHALNVHYGSGWCGGGRHMLSPRRQHPPLCQQTRLRLPLYERHMEAASAEVDIVCSSPEMNGPTVLAQESGLLIAKPDCQDDGPTSAITHQHARASSLHSQNAFGTALLGMPDSPQASITQDSKASADIRADSAGSIQDSDQFSEAREKMVRFHSARNSILSLADEETDSGSMATSPDLQVRRHANRAEGVHQAVSALSSRPSMVKRLLIVRRGMVRRQQQLVCRHYWTPRMLMCSACRLRWQRLQQQVLQALMLAVLCASHASSKGLSLIACSNSCMMRLS